LKKQILINEQNMTKKTLLLFQLFLTLFALYALLKFSGNQRLLVSLACLVGMLVLEKVETSFTERSKQEKDQSDDASKKDETKTTSQALDVLLKSKNVLLLTDAIQHLLRDLGLVVSPSVDHPAIDRLVKIPDMEVTCGLKILSDVAELSENWDKWQELDSFDLGKGGKRRLLIIGSNFIGEAGDRPQRYKKFPANTQKLLSDRQVVAMTTLALYKIYMLCKKEKMATKKIFHLIQHHPGGVILLERTAK
jgi:hypothetical protein